MSLDIISSGFGTSSPWTALSFGKHGAIFHPRSLASGIAIDSKNVSPASGIRSRSWAVGEVARLELILALLLRELYFAR